MDDAPFPRGKTERDDKTKQKRPESSATEDELFKVKRFRKVEPAKPTKSQGAKRKREAEKSNLLATPLPEVGLGMTKSVANNKVIKIDTINFGNYVTGSLALGYVLQVHDEAVVVSLPGGVSGTIQMSEISDVHNKAMRNQLDKATKSTVGELTDIISVMQPVRCYVLNSTENTAPQKKVKGRKTLNLSMRPSYVNRGLAAAHMTPGFPISGTVSSVEDRMYIISTGVSGFTFILPFSALPTALSPLHLGQPIDSVVDSINNPAKTITLRAQKKAVSSAVVAGVKLTFNSLAPGMMVKVIIDKIVDNGLIVGFFGLFFGTIDVYNLSRLYTGKDDWKTHFEEGGITQARIVYVDHANKSVRLSLRPHVLECRAPKYLPSLGEMLVGYSVSAIVKRTGLYMTSTNSELVNEAENLSLTVKKSSKKSKAADQKQRDIDEAAIRGIFVHKSSLADASGKESNVKGKESNGWESRYKVGKAVDVRVSGYHLVEGIAIASNVDAFMTGSVVHSSQVEVGQVIDVEVVKVADFGLVVKLGGKVRAICPLMHLSDTAGIVKTVSLMKKFKAGQTLTMRVWEVKGSQIVMTNKKSIVQAENALSSYSQAVEGTVAKGIVSKVSQGGLQIHFFNKVKGDIPSSILVQQGVTDIEESYRIGQVVDCFVLQRTMPSETSKKINSTLVLGLNLGNVSSLMISSSPMDTTNKNDSTEVPSERHVASSLEVVSGTAIKCENDTIHVRLENGKLALLHREHLCDLSCNGTSILAKVNSLYPVGKKVSGVVIGANKNGSVNISVKPLYLAAAGITASHTEQTFVDNVRNVSIPNKIEDMSTGDLVAGSVWKVEAYGILVRFRDGITALAPRPNVADSFISSPVGLFNVGDSVICVIQRVDTTRGRAIISLKPSAVPHSSGNMMYLTTLLHEKYLTAGGSSTIDWRHNCIGHIVKATVTAVKSYGVVLVGSDNVTMMLAKCKEGSNLNVRDGESVEALVLDVDFDNSILDVTLDSTLLSSAKKTQGGNTGKKKSKNKLCSVGEICHNVVVALVKSQYLVVIVRGSVCFVMVSDYHCPYKTTADYSVGDVISVNIEGCTSSSSSENMELSTPHCKVALGTVFNDAGGVPSTSETPESSLSKANLNGLSAESTDSPLEQQQIVDKLRIGTMLRCEVVEVNSIFMTVAPEGHVNSDQSVTATIHVSCAVDGCDGCDDLETILDKVSLSGNSSNRCGISAYHPFHGISIGSKVSARVLQVRHVDNDEEKRTVVYMALPPKKNKKKSPSNQWKRLLQWSGRESIKINTVYAGAITSIHRTHCQIALSPYISANMSILDISSDISLIEKFRDNCHVGMKVICTVTDLITGRQKNSVNISRALVEDIASGSVHVDLTKTVHIDPSKSSHHSSNIAAGDILQGVVDMNVHSHTKKPPSFSVILSNGKRGRVCVTETSDSSSWKDFGDLFASLTAQQELHQRRSRSGSNTSLLSTDSAFEQSNDCDIYDGKVVKCCVLSTSPSLELSLRNSRLHAKSKIKAVISDAIPVAGTVVQGYVANTTSKGCFVRLNSKITGRVLMKELSDDFVQNPADVFPPGKLVRAKVLSVTDNTKGDSENTSAIHVDLSLRSSVVDGEVGSKDYNSLRKGDVVAGTVHRVTDFGVFVAISGTSLIGLSRKAMATSDDGDLSAMYEEGDNVRAVVISKSVGNKIALGLKASYFTDELSNDDENEMDIDSDDSDDSVSSNDDSNDGGVSDEVNDSDSDIDNEEDSVEENGDYIVGYEDVSDSDDDDVAELIRNAAMHTGDTDNSDSDSESNENSDGDVQAKEDDEDKETLRPSKRVRTESLQSESDSSDNSSDNEDGDTHENSAGGAMMLNWGDSFKPAVVASNAKDDTMSDSAEDEDDSNSEGETVDAGHSGRRKVSERRKVEEETRLKEAALLNGSTEPSSPDDFERLLITQPNSSLLWIQYMSHFMLAADIESARGIAKRALRTINFREEDEKYNVWVALINLEHKYGTMSSLEKSFKQGISETKGKYLHIHLADLYDKADDIKGCRLIFERALKKHKTSKKVWMAYQHFEMRRGNDTEARALLGRSMLSLSRHKHIEVILQYASLEFELGNFDAGREVFEDLLQNYPKRTDIWNVFVDKEVKYKNITEARRLFERMICLKISAKNIKSIFKKYLTFELAHGSVNEQNGVKQKAREYVESLM